VLDQIGLAAALHQEARAFERRTGMHCTVVIAERLPAFSDGISLALYRIAAEALTNVARHSNAARVEVSLEAPLGVATLHVADDGCGLDRSASAGLGIAGMRQRAERLGGTLGLRSGPGGGVVLTAAIPVVGSSSHTNESTGRK